MKSDEQNQVLFDELIPLTEPTEEIYPDTEQGLQRLYQTMERATYTEKELSFWQQLSNWLRLPTVMVTAPILAILVIFPASWLMQQSNHRKSEHGLISKGTEPTLKIRFQGPKKSDVGMYSPSSSLFQTSPGNLIQLKLEASVPRHVMLISKNSQGDFFVYYPLQGQKSTLLQPGKTNYPRQSSMELDDILGEEHFYFLSSSQAFTLKEAKRLLKKQEKSLTSSYIKRTNRTWTVEKFTMKKSKP